ncbi:MAG: Trp family transcriptional regulator [Patescibacteria group bacterium]
MPHISKKKLESDTAEILGDQLLTFLSVARSKADAHILAQELLTKTERVMIAKRLAIIVMLERGHSFSEAEKVLKVTPQTITRVWRARKEGKYSKIARYAREYTRHFKKENAFVDFLDNAIRLGDFRAPGHAIRKGLRKSLAG